MLKEIDFFSHFYIKSRNLYNLEYIASNSSVTTAYVLRDLSESSKLMLRFTKEGDRSYYFIQGIYKNTDTSFKDILDNLIVEVDKEITFTQYSNILGDNLMDKISAITYSFNEKVEDRNYILTFFRCGDIVSPWIRMIVIPNKEDRQRKYEEDIHLGKFDLNNLPFTYSDITLEKMSWVMETPGLKIIK